MKLTIHKKIWIAISIMAILLATTLNFLIYNASKIEAVSHAEALITLTLKNNALDIERSIENGEYKLDGNAVELQTLVKNIQPFHQTKAFITTSDGIFLEHTNRNELGQSISGLSDELSQTIDLKAISNNGKNNIIRVKNKQGEKILFASTPLSLNNTNTKASIGITVPRKEITRRNKTTNLTLITIAIIGLLIMPLFGWFLGKTISARFTRTQQTLNLIAKGDLKDDIAIVNSNDEIGAINTTTNELIYGLRKAALFAKEMGKGNLKASFERLGEDDTLGDALVNMQKNLLDAENEEIIRKEDDEKRNWTTQGLAKFGEILRTNAQDIEKLSYEIVSNIINYLDINQGAMFVIDNEDESNPQLRATATVAYGRKKFTQKTMPMKSGIVGRCAFEKKTVYLTDVPNDYIEISSGLGTANPSAVLLIPLILNDQIFGVIELASFNQFEPHQIEFIEKLGESIASTISTVNINETTSKLLNQSKTQSEELAAQEEEMRQNLEELQATQEESSRREFEMQAIIKALGNTAFTVEYDMDGNVIYANQKYADLLREPLDNLIGTNHAQGYDLSMKDQQDYALFWAGLKQGKIIEQENKLLIKGQEIWVKETYSPIFEKEESSPHKVLKIGFDISEQYQKSTTAPHESELSIKNTEQLNAYKSKIQELEEKLTEASISIEEQKQTTQIPEQTIIAEAEATINTKVWNAGFELGIEEMDAQHKQLFDLAIQLKESITANKTKKELKENLRSIIDFAAYHFRNEESYFDSFEFEATHAHAESHAKFIKDLAQNQKNYQSNKNKDIRDLAEDIILWLAKHFTTQDILYKELFKQKGL